MNNMSKAQKKQFSFSENEKKILEFWKKNKIFEESVRQRKGKKKFIFYEGPPYANGKPGIHHVEVRAFKDIILRYKTMKGFYAPRKAGWDTHGLPTEMEVERKLGVKSKKEIEEKIGIERFVKEARKNVFLYKEEWEKLTQRIGYWLDLAKPYITMANDYIENLWFIIKKISDRKLLYEDYKVLPWCPRCQTALSSHELAQGYKTIKDASIYVKFRVLDPKICKLKAESYFLVWTTTPWTLPGNAALAINPKLQYSLVKFKTQNSKLVSPPKLRNGDEASPRNLKINNAQNQEEYLVLATSRLAVLGEDCEIIKEFKGKDLAGIKYEPLYESLDFAPQVLKADFVSGKEGSGIVHIAPAFGEEDLKLIKSQAAYRKISFPVTVSEEGIMKEKFPGAGEFIKDADKHIIENLKNRGLLFKIEKYEHDYPFCWRCQSPLMYYAKNSWWLKTSAVKRKMIKENSKINWHPEHLREGRFGEWLRDLRDWAVSRERYWGAPLPIWKCEFCEKTIVLGNLESFDKYDFGQTHLFVSRHGEAEHNVKDIIASKDEKHGGFVSHLTRQGVRQIKEAAKSLKKSKIDLIVSSPFIRTQETAEIFSKEMKVSNIVVMEELRELDVGVFDGKTVKEFHSHFKSFRERFAIDKKYGESLRDLRKRVMAAARKLKNSYQGKNILIVTHGDPAWILMAAMEGFNESDYGAAPYLKVGKVRKIKLHNWPYNDLGELDLHRPYIDKIKLKCEECGGIMERVLEVIDVWFDSGAMPFAQNQKFWKKAQSAKYKMQNLEKIIPYPADFICEAIDQTRGWFYTLLAISSLLSAKAPYKNVISSGLVLDEKGQKMSKSRGNSVDPWELVEKYGSDAVRWYFYTVNQPWDDKLFKEKDIQEALRRFIGILWNSFVYWKTYKNSKCKIQSAKLQRKIQLVINKWLVMRFNQLVKEVEKSLDNYDIVTAARKIEKFAVEDISHWYIRRIRGLMKIPGSQEAKETNVVFGKVLFELSKLIAPFVPFLAEEMYLRIGNAKKSVHLENFPKGYNFKLRAEGYKLLEKMEEARRIVSLALEARAKSGIKVRQPLSSLTVRSQVLNFKNNDELLNLIKGEINVKEVIFRKNLRDEVELNLELTPELKEEGFLREIIRGIQDLRKKTGLTPKDRPKLLVKANEKGKKFIEKYASRIKRETLLSRLELTARFPENIYLNAVKQDELEIDIAFLK
jgi:isoleucyl-tRNA synthetase